MNTFAEDKENCNPRSNTRNIPSQSNFGKARGFSALLESAQKETENDLNFSGEYVNNVFSAVPSAFASSSS